MGSDDVPVKRVMMWRGARSWRVTLCKSQRDVVRHSSTGIADWWEDDRSVGKTMFWWKQRNEAD